MRSDKRYLRGSWRRTPASPLRDASRRSVRWAIAILACVILLRPADAQDGPPSPVPNASAPATDVPSDALPKATMGGPAVAGTTTNGRPHASGLAELAAAAPEGWTTPAGLQSTIQAVLALTVISMAPAILLMTTSFVRIVVVLGLLRQALGIQQLPPSQVMTSIALFMTLLIMTPVWTDVYEQSIRPYTDPEVDMSLDEAWQAGVAPVRRFMSRQIEIAGNGDDIWLFYEYLPEGRPEIKTYDDVPLQVLLPAFMLSELKTSFLIGFQIYLPFLILDLVVASVTISMGMLMLPPTMISLPLKLMLFVMVDGWRLVVGMLLQSFVPY